jgi:hypothetical protein
MVDVVAKLVNHVGAHAVLQILNCMVNVEKRMKEVGGEEVYFWMDVSRFV